MTAPARPETRRHRRVCPCHPDDAPDDRRRCIAHGTAAHLARTAVAAMYPGPHLVHEHEVDPLGADMLHEIGEMEWHQARALRAERVAHDLPTTHLDVYLTVVRELLPESDRPHLDDAPPVRRPRGRVRRLHRSDPVRWYLLITDMERLTEATGWGLAHTWGHVHRGRYEVAAASFAEVRDELSRWHPALTATPTPREEPNMIENHPTRLAVEWIPRDAPDPDGPDGPMWCPVLLCNTCSDPIHGANAGLILWDEYQSPQVCIAVHKGRCDLIAEDRHGDTLLSQELELFLPNLLHNSGLSRLTPEATR